MTDQVIDSALLFQLSASEDPRPIYDALIAEGPIHWCEPLKRWAVVGDRATREILRDAAFVSSGPLRSALPRFEARTGISFPALNTFAANSVTGMDPPDHGVARRLLVKAINHRGAEEIRAVAEQLVATVAAKAREQGSFDLVDDYSRPISCGITAELLGLPPDDIRDLGPVADDLMGTSESPLISLRTLRQHEAMAERGIAYFVDRLAERDGGAPEDGLTVIRRGMAGKPDEDIAAACLFMLCAGIELTGNFIAWGGVTLLRDPPLRESLGRSPSAAAAMVERLLAENPPFQGVNRIAAEDRIVEGIAIPAGSRVTLFLAAANRDPAASPSSRPVHLTFGDGPHACIGAALARMEATLAFSGLASLPSPIIDEASITWNDRRLLRAMTHVTVRLAEAA